MVLEKRSEIRIWSSEVIQKNNSAMQRCNNMRKHEWTLQIITRYLPFSNIYAIIQYKAERILNYQTPLWADDTLAVATAETEKHQTITHWITNQKRSNHRHRMECNGRQCTAEYTFGIRSRKK